jgi:small conductance mechanosensitive channel
MPNISLEEGMKLLADASLDFAESALRIILVIVAGYIISKVVKVAVRHLEAILIRLGEIILVIVAGYIISKVVKVAVRHLEAILIRLGEGSDDVPGATRKRVTTLMNVLRTVAVVVIWGVVVVVTLEQFGLAVGPILAAAGVLGLAVGFGAQNLVRDVISGFFLILENQVRVGDVAIINGTGGLVEAVTFRTVVLRDLSAVVHVFPNGAITTLSNMTKGWSAYVINMGVAYKEDTDRVAEVMRQVADEMKADPDYGPSMLDTIEIFGVDDFADSAVVIKARLKTLPIKQWGVGREYRRRLKKAFDENGIEIPFPHLSVYMGEASRAFDVLVKEAAGRPK